MCFSVTETHCLVIKPFILSVTPQLTAFLKILVCKHTAEQNVAAPMYFEVNKRNEVCKPEV